MKFFFQKSNTENGNRKAGFSLVETLVAVSIFSLAVVSLMSSMSKSIADTGYAKKKIIATGLAQEGVEYMRNLRDTYVLYDAEGAQTGWNNFNSKLAASSCSTANGCFFNADGLNYGDTSQPMIDITLTACSSSTCPNGTLLHNATTGRYNYASGVNSGFSRSIKVIQSSNQTKISSTVFWTQGSGPRNVVFSEDLFNWIE